MATGEPPWLSRRRLATSRGRASCSSASAASIVGTTSVAVTRWASMSSSAAAASNTGSITWHPPCHTVASTAIEPAAWKSGAATSQHVSGRKANWAWK